MVYKTFGNMQNMSGNRIFYIYWNTKIVRSNRKRLQRRLERPYKKLQNANLRKWNSLRLAEGSEKCVEQESNMIEGSVLGRLIRQKCVV